MILSCTHTFLNSYKWEIFTITWVAIGIEFPMSFCFLWENINLHGAVSLLAGQPFFLNGCQPMSFLLSRHPSLFTGCCSQSAYSAQRGYVLCVCSGLSTLLKAYNLPICLPLYPNKHPMPLTLPSPIPPQASTHTHATALLVSESVEKVTPVSMLVCLPGTRRQQPQHNPLARQPCWVWSQASSQGNML